MAETPVLVRDAVWSPGRGEFCLGPLSASGEAGCFIAVVGPNGAGKSSLLNLVAGLNTPQKGEVTVFGHAPADWPPRHRGRKVAYLSQDSERPFGFTVDEYVSLGRFPHLGPFRKPSGRDREVVDGELDAWEIRDLMHREVTGLSGGEFQRVRLARSLSQEPGLLLLDEPGNHLDLASRVKILRRLKEEASQGRCVMAVLHDVNDALLYADSVWLLSGGRIIDSGEPGKVLDPVHLEAIYRLKLTPFRDASGSMMLGVL